MTDTRPDGSAHRQLTTKTAEDGKIRTSTRQRPPRRESQADGTDITSGTRGGEDVLLRSDSPPIDQLDFDDRHDTRATQSEELANRYAALRKDRRRSEWQRLCMNLVAFFASMVLILAGIVSLSLLLPHLEPWSVAQLVLTAYAFASGGIGTLAVMRFLKERYGRRPPPP